MLLGPCMLQKLRNWWNLDWIQLFCLEPRQKWEASWQNKQNDCAPAKTQISLGICPIWSEFSLSAWRKLGFLAIHWAHREDWSESLLYAQSFCWFCYEAAKIKVFDSKALAFASFKFTSFTFEPRHEKKTTTKWMCAQRRLRSAWASAQSDQSLRCALNG